MKRTFLFIAFAVVVGTTLFADESVLIDFSKLVADVETEEGKPKLNAYTAMDYRNQPGMNNFTQEQLDAMKTSLALENWLVELSSSSQSVVNGGLSKVKEATSGQYGPVMGVRVHFPSEMYHGWALIRPPFEIPAYDTSDADAEGNLTVTERSFNDKTRFEEERGVVKNVGTVKSIAVDVYGLNFPHTLYVIYEDGDGNVHEISMGSLNFDGWGELTWTNPQYITDVRQRTLRIYPLYPTYAPYIKFAGFRIKRDAMHEGGDFIVYFKDVKVIYDKAQLDEPRDIDDEQEWGIIQAREDDKAISEQKNFGLDQVYRYQETQKQAKELPFGDPNRPTAAATEEQ